MHKYEVECKKVDTNILDQFINQIKEIDNVSLKKQFINSNEYHIVIESKNCILDKVEKIVNALNNNITISPSTFLLKENEEEKLYNEIHNLIGCNEFKDLIDEIYLIAEQIKKRNTYSVFFSQSYLLSINDGCGATTLINYLKKTIRTLKLNENLCDTITEITINRDNLTHLKKIAIVENMSRVIVYDISDIIDILDTPIFRDFLSYLRDFQDKNIFVFRVPCIERKYLENINTIIDNILNVREIIIPPLSNNYIKEYAKKFFKKYGYEKLDDDFWRIFLQLISMEKYDGKFYGIETVEKVVNKIIYKKILDIAQRIDNGEDVSDIEYVITGEFISQDLEDELSGEKMLDQLIGLDNIKQEIKNIINKMVNEKNLKMNSGNHMIFYGNPGTGKTTVARIVAKMMREAGVLTVGNLQEIHARQLCGTHIGETAPKTLSICQDAYGSVLFIDEAYSLYNGEIDSKDYGREALNVLATEIENNRSDFVVIFAGYEEHLKKTLEINPGLIGRFSYQIEFPNYTRDELFNIFMRLIDEKFTYGSDFPSIVNDYFLSLSDEIMEKKTFSNARFVRNLYEKTYGNALARHCCIINNKIRLEISDFLNVINIEDFEILNAKVKKVLIS